MLQKVDGVEIIFVSSDQSQKDMLSYMKESHGDWWAVEHGSSTAEALSTHYKIRNIPTLIVLDGNGKLISNRGQIDVINKGLEALDEWKR